MQDILSINDAAALKKARGRLRRGLRQLAGRDEEFAAAIDKFGHPEPRLRAGGFAMLLHTIVSQQLSVHAAEAIWRRVRQRFPELEPGVIVRCRDQTLRNLGLSARKVEYVKSLARAYRDESSGLAELELLEDEQAIETITAVKGLGIWSAEIYLMFSLQRDDIFPADDLALQVAIQHLKGLKKRPSGKEARLLVEHWQPYRSAGSLFLWHYYRHAVKTAGKAK